MKVITIYWKRSSDDLSLLSDTLTVTCGSDGMEVLGMDTEIEKLRTGALEHPDLFEVASVRRATPADIEQAVQMSKGNWPEFADEDALLKWIMCEKSWS